MVVGVAMVGGCGADPKSKQQLTAGYAALENRQYDQAISGADEYLRSHPAGPGSAEALYLRGRALEQKPAASLEQARANLQAARGAYIEALGRSPSRRLEAYVHTSLANVAYFQDDYPTAISEWTTAYGMLEDESIKAWVLYRIGLSRQRLGQFADADATFAAVMQRYPNTVPAQRARERHGARAFHVQMATFAQSNSADAAINELRAQGVPVHKQIDSKGRSVVLVGPLASYQQAQAMKARYAGKYPDAVIVP
jgi:outer membrane protein assembly factor BamD (BamD/ComL family)